MDVDVPLGFRGRIGRSAPSTLKPIASHFSRSSLVGPCPPISGTPPLGLGSRLQRCSAKRTVDTGCHFRSVPRTDLGYWQRFIGLHSRIEWIFHRPQRMGSSKGEWRLVGDGATNESGWEGRLTASHPAGDVITTAWNVTTEPSTWSFSTDTRVERLVPKADEATPWNFSLALDGEGQEPAQKTGRRYSKFVTSYCSKIAFRAPSNGSMRSKAKRRCVVAGMGLVTRVGQSNLQHCALNRVVLQPYPFGF